MSRCFLAVALTAAAAPAFSQSSDIEALFYQPTSFADCARHRMPSYGPMMQANEEEKACTGDRNNGPANVITCVGWTPRACVKATKRACELPKKVRREVEMCMEKASAYLEREKARKKQEEAQQKAVDALRDTEAAQVRDQEFGPTPKETAHIKQMIKTALANGDYRLASALAERGAKGLGYNETPAMALSRAVTRGAMGEFSRMTQFANGEFMSAMGSGAFDIDTTGGASSGNNRMPIGPGAVDLTSPEFASLYPPASDSFNQMVDNWDEMSPISQGVTIAALLIQMVAIMKSDGPVNPSLLDGSFAAAVGGMTEALVSGQVRVSDLANGSMDVAQARTTVTMAAVERTRSERIAQEQQRAAEAERLKADRLEAERREREEAERRRRAEIEKQRTGGTYRFSGDASQCVKIVTRDARRVDVTNSCREDIRCYTNLGNRPLPLLGTGYCKISTYSNALDGYGCQQPGTYSPYKNQWSTMTSDSPPLRILQCDFFDHEPHECYSQPDFNFCKK